MTIRRWYMLMLFSPLLLPLMVLGLGLVYGYESLLLAVGMLVRLLFVSSLIAAMPYVPFALGVLYWLRNKTVADIKKLSWYLPWAFTPVCGLFFFVAFSFIYPDGDAVMSALILMAFCVPVGFCFVIAVHLLTRLLQRAGMLQQPDAQP